MIKTKRIILPSSLAKGVESLFFHSLLPPNTKGYLYNDYSQIKVKTLFSSSKIPDNQSIMFCSVIASETKQSHALRINKNLISPVECKVSKKDFELSSAKTFKKDFKIIKSISGNLRTHSITPPVKKKVSTIKKREIELSMKKVKTVSMSFAATNRLKIEKSKYLNNAPHTRRMINLKYLSYPQISEFIQKLAEDNKVSYTKVQLIGIFDHIPLHLATNLSWDSINRRLQFFIRSAPKGEKRFCRIAYGQIKNSDKVIFSVSPLK